ncbi:MAG: Trk family potassium uptake protein [Clostridia bacterium]|nr:Trk family potassium uptake protein [Clostridia bacterium]
MKKKRKFKLSIWRILALGYLITMFLGSVLLILPFATRAGESTSYIDALFTAASATFITGLAPYDTATHWTLFGQLVMLFLIQLGGLGFMTVVSVIFVMFRHGMGLHERRVMMMDAGGGSTVLTGVKKLVIRIVAGSLIIEAVGALLLCIRFIPQFGALKGIYYSIWHSVSAFCNAGFDLMGTELVDGSVVSVSLTNYATDPLVSLTICCLIILGGLGFCVWGEVMDIKFNLKKASLNTKVILIVNAVLLIGGTLLYLLFERNNPSYAGFNFGEKLLASFFNSTTARTAGFSTTAVSSLSDSGFLLTILLMFIGGSSGSTAGGLKVGTFAVITMGMIGVFRGRRDINIGKRRIEYSLLLRALAILTACLMTVIISTLIICGVEPHEVAHFDDALFLSVSALSTAGLGTCDIASFCWLSKLILIILMLAGRVGVLTFALALGEKKTTAEIRRPVENILIG